MRTTIYLPDDLAKRIEEKLGNQNLSKFIQQAVEKELAQKDVAHFLEFAGAVSDAPHHADEEAEDF